MTWNEQAMSMMNVWTEAQKAAWESWSNVLQGMAAPAGFMSGMGMFDQWQNMASQGAAALTENAEPTVKNLSRQMVAAQATMMRFLEMTTRAWNTMIPKLESGQEWQSVLQDYMEQARKQMMAPFQSMQSSQGITDMWQSYVKAMQSSLMPWMKPMQQTPGLMGASMAGEGGSAIIDLTRMYWDAYNQTVGTMVSMPGVGFTRELEEKFAKNYHAWTELMQAMEEYQLLVADAWAGVQEEVLREMMRRAEQGQPIESVRDLVRLWTSSADASFAKVLGSEKYSEVQGRFVSAFMEYRVKEQAVVDEMMKYAHIPTRTEMDEAHRNIYELRKDVKAIKKAMNMPVGVSLTEDSKEPAADKPAKKPAAKKAAEQEESATEKPAEQSAG